MKTIKTYPEMNKEIVNILRLEPHDNSMNLYAAQLIEEQAHKIGALEQALKKHAPCQTCKGLEECEKHGKANACTFIAFKPDAWQFDESRFGTEGEQL